MLITSVVSSIGGLGVLFYLRFLVAICREYEPRVHGYWIRLRLHGREATVTELRRIAYAEEIAA